MPLTSHYRQVIPPDGNSKLKVSERDFVPLWDGTVMRRSLAERKLLEGL